MAAAFLAALQPAALQACLAAAQQLEDGHDAALDQWRRQVEQARYHAGTAERRYRAVDPDNRLVARGLETEWNTALQQLADAENELARREAARPKTLTPHEKQAILALGDDLTGVWSAATTTDKDRKRLLRTLLDEVGIGVHRDQDQGRADLLLRWKGGAITELSVPLKRNPPQRLRTGEDTIDLLRRLAAHYPDATIAGILNRQGRRTARGMSFTASRVQSLRHHWKIPCHQPGDAPTKGEPLTVADAAHELGLAPSTLHRWLNEGFIAGEQITPGAPWRIRLTDDIRALFVDDTPEGWLAMLEATLAYGVSRQTLMQRVKRGELQAAMVLRYLHRPHRSREIASRAHPVPQLVEVVRLRHREPLDADRIHTRRPTVGPDLLPRPIDKTLVDLKRLHPRLRSHPRLLPRGMDSHRVDLVLTVDCPVPSLQPHYQAFIATTNRSAPVPRIGTLPLTVITACGSPSRDQ